MSRKETLPLVVALLTTALLIGGGVWWLSQRVAKVGDAPSGASSGAPSAPALDGTNGERFSAGEKLLAAEAGTSPALSQKQAGIAAFAAQNYPEAVTAFTAALKAKRNDPEALIYLNNAKVGTQPAFEVAIAVPLDSDLNGSLEMLRGVAQAQTEFNQAAGGKLLKVLIVNDGGETGMARQVATALVNNPAVLGVVGHNSSDMSLAAGEIYTQGKLVMISPTSTSVKLSNFSPYVFRTVPSDFVAARALANYMVTELKQQQAAVFFNSRSAYSQSLKSEFGAALSLEGGQVVNEFDLAGADFDANSSLQQAQQSGAAVLALFPNSDLLDRALQVLQLNQRRLPLLGGDDVYSPKTLSVGGAVAQDISIAVPWHILANTNSSFVKTSRQLWGADVNWRTATSYDAVSVFTGVAAAEPDLSREKMHAALARPSFSVTNGSGVVKFTTSGDRSQSIQLVTVTAGKRSGTGYDFVPLP
ncbi:MAG: ABC transporter substrate-binding protein [Pegethrix bostrychoides GSE-TBD4-15B]|jgi:branched-chain amino acid transport system substrate-binding protein|uniref:ABC transporter substrate-binding protein n=1 Tax=Pegethrix bostrychoides GSE-TBD4-15B TaxID=2839662 RepID=A0A951PF62_9CYAN|nr:ABC transporter substrate-binding protein [Pegethrix bostrychoides GSE-TBD4-15B]